MFPCVCFTSSLVNAAFPLTPGVRSPLGGFELLEVADGRVGSRILQCYTVFDFNPMQTWWGDGLILQALSIVYLCTKVNVKANHSWDFYHTGNF